MEYLFWVGCAGALEDRARKTTRAIATLLHTAGVNFAVLGPAETCTGDPARRIGNEFVFPMLAQQNVETLNEARPRTIVASCPHCFNTIANEYPQLGGNYQVIHHTQLLARLVAEGKLTPVTPIEEKITYHDPCFLGRHNKVFSPPREIMEQVPGVQAQEMHRCKERGFCCGAGGARMWMEERIGKRINTERIDEALGTSPDTISTGCPYCLVMLGDAISGEEELAARPRTAWKSWTWPSCWPARWPPRSRLRPRLPTKAARPAPAAPPPTPTAEQPGMDTRRAEAFSDGVFAVAITVLVFNLLEINPPVLHYHDLIRAWPSYFAYVVSFLTIGIMWMNHHTMFAHIGRVDRPLLVLNLLLLMGIVAIPFPTALVAKQLQRLRRRARRRHLRPGHDPDLAGLRWAVGICGHPRGHAGRPGRAAGAAPVHPRLYRRAARVRGRDGAGRVRAAGGRAHSYGLLGVYYLFEHLPAPTRAE